jgi:hypothetical protein
MNDEPSEDSTGNLTIEEAKKYITGGGGYDVAAAAYLLAHGIPVPPSLVGRFRKGVGRLVDSSFNLLGSAVDRRTQRANFENQVQQGVIKTLAKQGASDLSAQPGVSAEVALSMIREYGLKFDNKSAVAKAAFEALEADRPTTDPTPDADLDEDWLNYFSEIAGQKSSQEMQKLMGRILAGEIRRPGSFSPLSIHALSTLTPSVAQKFQALCSVTVHINGTRVVPVFAYPQFLIKGIPELGITYSDVLLLRSYQLLANEQGSEYTAASGRGVRVDLAGKTRVFTPNNGERVIKVALLSQVGAELSSLIEISINPELESKVLAILSAADWSVLDV